MCIPVINPQTKLQWVESNWSQSEAADAKAWVVEAVSQLLMSISSLRNLNSLYQMLVHQRAVREAKKSVPESAGRRRVHVPSNAARSQARGMAELDALAQKLSRDHLREAQSGLESPLESSQVQGTPLAVFSDEELKALDIIAVKEELNRWKAAGLMTAYDEIADFDLVAFWQVR